MIPTTPPEREAFGGGRDFTSVVTVEKRSGKSWVVLWWSFVFALLQGACSAVIAISGIRVAIGLSALAAAAGVDASARGFHADWIRIPMMLLALAGAVVNLYVA